MWAEVWIELWISTNCRHRTGTDWRRLFAWLSGAFLSAFRMDGQASRVPVRIHEGYVNGARRTNLQHGSL